jgi:hypothetical protein
MEGRQGSSTLTEAPPIFQTGCSASLDKMEIAARRFAPLLNSLLPASDSRPGADHLGLGRIHKETRCAMRVTVLVPGKWIRATDDDGSDLTPDITSPSFGLNANSTKQQVIDAWAQHDWKLTGQCDSAGASLFVVDR